MNKKLRDVMAYIYANVSHKSDLSKARMTKLVYLADWKMSQKYGRSISNIDWVFNHYGPYVEDVVNLARDDAEFGVVVSRNAYGSMKERIEYLGLVGKYSSLGRDEVSVLDEVVKETEGMYFNKFIEHVYSTYPVKESSRYDVLDLPKMARKEARSLELT